MGSISWERTAAILFCVGAGSALLYLSFRFAFPFFLPFLIAWLISLAVRPLAEGLARRTGLSKSLCAALLLLLFLGGALFLVGASVWRLVLELQHLLERLLSEGGGVDDWVEESFDFFDAVTSRIGFLRHIGAGERFAAFRDAFNKAVADMIGSLLTSLTAGIPAFLTGLIAALPSAFLVTFVTVISSFYFCIDGEKIANALCRCLPSSMQRRIPAWKQGLKRISWRYLKAYLLLLLLTFAELFLGFSILRVDYAFLLAILIALVDLLPVLGVGTVLLPWAVVLLIQRNFYMGFGLLILFFAVLLLRQIAEPKLIGKSLGLHPLLALFAGYAGWWLLGFWGLLLGPFLALFCKTLFEQQRTSDVSDSRL